MGVNSRETRDWVSVGLVQSPRGERGVVVLHLLDDGRKYLEGAKGQCVKGDHRMLCRHISQDNNVLLKKRLKRDPRMSDEIQETERKGSRTRLVCLNWSGEQLRAILRKNKKKYTKRRGD